MSAWSRRARPRRRGRRPPFAAAAAGCRIVPDPANPASVDASRSFDDLRGFAEAEAFAAFRFTAQDTNIERANDTYDGKLPDARIPSHPSLVPFCYSRPQNTGTARASGMTRSGGGSRWERVGLQPSHGVVARQTPFVTNFKRHCGQGSAKPWRRGCQLPPSIRARHSDQAPAVGGL